MSAAWQRRRLPAGARGLRLAGAVLCLLAAGCATVRQAREAQDGRTIPAGERTVAPAEIGLPPQVPLTLDRAIEIALTCHPAVVRAQQALIVASNQVGQVKAGRGPSIEGNAGYRRGTSNTALQRGSHDAENSYSGGLSLNQLLCDFGKTAASVKRSEALLQSAAEGLRATRNDVIFQVRLAFHDLARAQQALGVAEETEQQYLRRLEQVRGLVEVGRRIKYDITKVEVDLGNARLDLINSRGAVATARATLVRRLGLKDDPLCPLAEEAVKPYASNYEERVEVARRRQPELLALRAQVWASSLAVDMAVADLYPALSLNGEYLWTGGGFPLFWNWAGAIRAGMSLFDGGRKTSVIRATVAELRSARTQEAEREEQLCLDLRTAFAQLDSARERQGLTALIARQAQENLELVNERYRLGQASSVDVTDAQAALSQARAGQVKARFDYQGAVAAILHATGEEER
jgi:outer membrane protein TolC